MPRYLIQSLDTGRFLAPSPEDGQPEWVVALSRAGGGVVDDYDRLAEMVPEYSEIGERVQIVDLDRLGTKDDYDYG